MVRHTKEEPEPEQWLVVLKHKGKWIAGMVDKETALELHRSYEGAFY